MLEEIIQRIREERKHQDEKWGEQNHHPYKWLAVIGEEKGEADKAALEADWRQDQNYDDYEKELIELAACAIAAIECRERNKETEKYWKGGMV